MRVHTFSADAFELSPYYDFGCGSYDDDGLRIRGTGCEVNGHGKERQRAQYNGYAEVEAAEATYHHHYDFDSGYDSLFTIVPLK